MFVKVRSQSSSKEIDRRQNCTPSTKLRHHRQRRQRSEDMSTSFPILPVQTTGDGDSLHYAIYPVYPDVNLKNILDYTLDMMATWTDNYIWNLDPFTLALDSNPPRLHGTMDMGEDSGVSPDEWVVVGVLWNISRRFPNVVIRCSKSGNCSNCSVQDGEGEFLLIESALHIPDWLKPETAENRVWIHNGELKVIPLEEFTSHDPPPLALDDALSHIRSAIRSEGTTASLFTDSGMNHAMRDKIQGFPQELQEQRHLARVMIPRLLAQVIHRNPQVIAPAVQSFYTRTTEFKKLREFRYFIPKDWITANIQCSRPLFAMLKSQKFNPPPAFPARDLSASEREMYSLGIKLTCAFELLASSDSSWTRRVVDLWNTAKERGATDAEIEKWTENCEDPSDEAWMTLSAEDVKRIMVEDKSEEEQVREMIANFERFIEGESGFEGIDDEFEDFDSEDEMEDDEDLD